MTLIGMNRPVWTADSTSLQHTLACCSLMLLPLFQGGRLSCFCSINCTSEAGQGWHLPCSPRLDICLTPAWTTQLYGKLAQRAYGWVGIVEFFYAARSLSVSS